MVNNTGRCSYVVRFPPFRGDMFHQVELCPDHEGSTTGISVTDLSGSSTQTGEGKREALAYCPL